MDTYKFLIGGITLGFGVTISFMVVKNLLMIMAKYSFINFDFITPQSQLATIILVGLAFMGILSFICALVYNIFYK